MNQHPDETLVRFFEITLATVVLVYSLLMDSKEFALRSHKQYECGVELDSLMRRALFLTIQANQTKPNFEDVEGRFMTVLDKYENHDNVDFWSAQLMQKQSTLGRCQRVYLQAKVIRTTLRGRIARCSS